MLYSGIVSVTFRELEPAEIISLVSKAGLDGIEWGGDVHVPHGDVKKAREVYKMTTEAGLRIPSYGSYFVVGKSSAEGLDFDRVLESAAELHAPIIRVWAGETGSRQASAGYWYNIVEETRRICAAAQKHGINISFEYHNDSLTDTPESTVKLIKDIGADNISTYWQAELNTGTAHRLESLRLVSPWLTNMHVFQYDGDVQVGLSDGQDEWKEYFGFAAGIKGDRYCMLEFVKDSLPEQLQSDAAVLKRLLQAANAAINK